VDGPVVSSDVVRADYARLDERITRIFGDKGLRGAVFLDVAIVIVAVWIDSPLLKLALLILRSY
jgi:hypothetical protein